MKSFQIFNSVKDATILAADTSGLLKDAKVKVSFEFVKYLRNGVFVEENKQRGHAIIQTGRAAGYLHPGCVDYQKKYTCRPE